MDNVKFNISESFVALGEAGAAHILPVSPTFWQDLAMGKLGNFSRLVSYGHYEADWPSWEMHPNGEEFVMLLEGDVEVLLKHAGAVRSERLSQSGAYVLIPRGTWHTAKIHRASRMFFITAGEGTEHQSA